MSREGCIAELSCPRGGLGDRPPVALQRKSAAAPRSVAATSPEPASRGSDRQRNRFAPLGRVDDPHVDLLALREMGDAGRSEDRDMDEDVLAAVLARHEAEALGVVEPLDLAGDRDGGRRIGSGAARPRRIAERALRPLDGARRRRLRARASPARPWRRRRPERAVLRPAGPSRARRRATHWRAGTHRPGRRPVRRSRSPCRP